MEELNAAYRPLILQWHPDRHHGSPDESIAHARATTINAAYAFLQSVLESELAATVGHPAPSKTARPASVDGFPDASVLEIFVKSSNIISVGYNGATADLFVKYLGHRIYRYSGVPQTVVEALLVAPSPSAFVSEHIDRRYEYEAYKRTT